MVKHMSFLWVALAAAEEEEGRLCLFVSAAW